MRDRLPEVVAAVTVLVCLMVLLSYMGTCEGESFPTHDAEPIPVTIEVQP